MINMDSYHYKYIVKTLGDIVACNNCGYILYPFGEYGVVVKEIINEIYHIKEKKIIDNGLSRTYEYIGNLEDLRQMELDNCKVLITSNKQEIYDELRDSLYAVVEREKCVELLPPPGLVVARLLAPDVNAKLEREGITLENPIYHPKKTKSIFFLPLLTTDYIQRSILLYDDYFDRHKLDYMFRHYGSGIIAEKVSSKGGVILDIGANIGNHTLFFCNELNVQKVYCFEPVQETFSILARNIKLNNLEKRVVLNSFALGENAGKGSIQGYNIYNIGATSLQHDENGMLEIKSLDSLDIQEPITLIKIDVEGMEKEVIKGGVETIKKNYPYIMVESFEEKFPETEKLLCEIGYRYECLGNGDWLFYPV